MTIDYNTKYENNGFILSFDEGDDHVCGYLEKGNYCSSLGVVESMGIIENTSNGKMMSIPDSILDWCLEIEEKMNDKYFSEL